MHTATINLFSGASSESLFVDFSQKINQQAKLLNYTHNTIIKRETNGNFSLKDNEDWQNGNEDFLKQHLLKVYGDYFTIINSISIVQFNLIVSLGDNSAIEIICAMLKTLQELIKNNQILIKINLIVPLGKLSLLFDGEEITLSKRQRNFKTIDEFIKTAEISCKIFIVQDRNIEGQIIHLDKNDFLNFLYEINSTMVFQYPEIYNHLSNLIYASIGISTLYYDQDYLSSLLQSESYIYLIEKEGINKDEVIGLRDITRKATEILKPYYDLYKSFGEQDYNNNPNERLEDNIPRFVDEFFKRINLNLLSFLHRQDISIYYKRAIFAFILGEFDDILAGYNNQYDENTLKGNRTLEDAEYTLYSFFFDLKANSSDLWAYDDIKINKNEILISKQYIKKLKSQLDSSKRNIENLSENTKIVLESDQPEHNKKIESLKRFNVSIAGKIGETYEKIISSVAEELDLSANFYNENRNSNTSQEANAVVDVYEYFFNKSGQKLKFSAEFIDYELKKHFGNNQYSFANILSTISETGVCQLSSFSINDTSTLEDAKKEALQFKLNKALDIECDEKKIKSALNEGYPIIIILKVFDSFYHSIDNKDPILPFPDDIEITNGTTNQQLFILCGYNQKKELFLAKIIDNNDIGDNGFYYIPNQYLFNTDFFLSGFILKDISGTNSSLTLILPSDKGKSFFNINDNNIKFFILKSNISIQNFLLKKAEDSYLNERHKYEEQKAEIGDPSIRKSLIEEKVKLIRDKEIPLQKQIDENNIQIESREILIRKFNIYKVLTIILFLLSAISYFYYFNIKEFPESVAIITVIAFLYLIYRTSEWKSEIKRLKDSISMLNEEKANIPPEVSKFILKAEIHGELIDGFVQFKSGLISKYKQFGNLIENLEEWHKKNKNIGRSIEEQQGPFFQIINKELLLEDFKNQKEALLSTIKLSDSFDLEINNNANNEKIIKKFKESVNQILFQKLIQNRLDDFDIIDYLTGTKNYNYLSAPSEMTQLSDLQKCAKPFIYLRNNVIHPEENSWFILERNQTSDMQNLMNRDFNPTPFFVKDEKNKLQVTFVNIIKIDNLEDVIALNEIN